jgi:hypothetical protein
MLPRVSGFNCSHALPFNIDKRTGGGRQALRASGGCVPGRRIPAQQAGELRDGEHRAGPAAGVRRQRGTGSLPGAEKHWFARCEARLTLHGVDRLDSRVLRYSQGSYLSGDGRHGRKTLGPRRKDVWLANVSTKTYGSLTCARNRRLTFTAQFGKVALHITRSRRQAPPPASAWADTRVRPKMVRPAGPETAGPQADPRSHARKLWLLFY